MEGTKSSKNLAILLFALAVSMIGFAYACVPLYKLFCQKTGFAGTPRTALLPSTMVIDRLITVQFTADVNRNLPCQFETLQHRVTHKIGENGLVFFAVENLTDQPIMGMATFNVSPDKAAPYFNKVECFCFERQLLPPHKRLELPVLFFVDPEFDKDPELKDVKLITLSYTFFRLNA